MTQLRDAPVRTPSVSRVAKIWEWVVAVLGTVVTVLGGWILAQSDDAVLSIFGWDWRVGELHSAWPVTMVIIGAVAVITAAALLIPTRRS